MSCAWIGLVEWTPFIKELIQQLHNKNNCSKLIEAEMQQTKTILIQNRRKKKYKQSKCQFKQARNQV